MYAFSLIQNLDLKKKYENRKGSTIGEGPMGGGRGAREADGVKMMKGHDMLI